MSKIIERLAQREFFDFSSRFIKMSDHQSGHKKRHSTETALMYVTDHFWKQLANCITVSIRRLMTGHEVNRVVSLGDLFYSLKFWSWKFIKPRFKVGCRSTFAGALSPSDVIDFAMLSAQRFWQETVLLFAVMWPGSNQRERAQYVGKKFPAKVKPLLSGHLRGLPKCSLNRGLYKMRNVC